MENKDTIIRYRIDKNKRAKFFNSKLPTGAKLVYRSLLDHLFGKDYCWPSQKRIAKEVGLSKRQVGYHLETLKKAGFLTWKKGGKRSDGTGYISNTYNLRWILEPYTIAKKGGKK